MTDFKEKKLKKKFHQGEWAFKYNKVILRCYTDQTCTIFIKGHEYALNGLAKMRLGLQTPHEAKLAYDDKSVNNFLSLALKLIEDEANR